MKKKKVPTIYWGRVLKDLEYEREALRNELQKAQNDANFHEAYEASIKLEYVGFILDELITGNIHEVPSKRRKP